jgi:hypothetical protein
LGEEWVAYFSKACIETRCYGIWSLMLSSFLGYLNYLNEVYLHTHFYNYEPNFEIIKSIPKMHKIHATHLLQLIVATH